MKRLLLHLLPVLLALAWCLPAVQAQTKFDPQARVDAIAPFLDSQTVAVAHVDVSRLDVTAAIKLATGIIPVEALPPKEELAKINMAGEGFRQMILKAGGGDFYLVISLADVPQNPPFVVATVKEGGDTQAIIDLLAQAPEFSQAQVIQGRVVAGTEATLARIKTMKPVPRPDLVKAFEAARDTAAQLVASPTDDARRVISEMVGPLPKELGDISGKDIVDGFQWLAAGLDAPPKVNLHVTIQGKDAAATGKMKRLTESLLALITSNEEIEGVVPTIKQIVKLLTPRQEGNQLVLALGESDGSLKKLLDELIKPAADNARKAAQRMISINNLKQLMLAMHNYHDVHTHFPGRAGVSKDGKPLLSWRVYLLPYVEAAPLYDQFHLDEPWDSDHNKKLIEKMPKVFASPAMPQDLAKRGMTTYLVPVGEKTIFEGLDGIKFSAILDGTSNTIAVVEANAENAVIWTKPDDLKVDMKNPLKGLTGVWKETKVFLVGLCDGSVRAVNEKIDPATLKRLFQKDDGEPIGDF